MIPGRKTGISAFFVYLKPDLHTGCVRPQQETGPARAFIEVPRAAVRRKASCWTKNSLHEPLFGPMEALSVAAPVVLSA